MDMKQYKKIIDGRTEIKSANRIIIRNSDMQIINPTEEMILADGWEDYIEPVSSDYVKLVTARRDKLFEIERYNTSNAVDEFYLNNMPMWLDNTLRNKLFRRLEVERAAGFTDTTLWYNGISYTLKVEQAIQMLYAIEMYASACYDNTQRHLAAVKQLKTIEEVEAYDYTTGYPEKLHF